MKQRISAHILAAFCVLLLPGCARLSDAGTLLFSSNLQAAAVVNGQLLQGMVQLSPDRTGSVTLQAEPGADQAPISSCMGRLRFGATTSGTMDLRCNEGTATELVFSLIGDARGYAYGQTVAGPVSLAFGLSPGEAIAYLTVPANKKLTERAGTPYFDLR